MQTNSSVRLNEILTYLKISANKLSVNLGLSANTKVYYVKNGRNEFSPEMAKLISEKYPEINYEWILNGKGEMLNASEHKETTSQERLKLMIEYLKMSSKTFSYEIGFSTDMLIMAVKNGEKDFDANIAQRVVKKYPNIRYEWILTGQGEMLINPNEEYTANPELSRKEYATKMAVRLVSNKAKAGWSDDFYSDEYLEDMPIVMIDADQEHRGKYLAFEVEGDSMQPDYIEGNIVICREVQRHLWAAKLHYEDWDFVIVHNTRGIMLKEIIAHNVEKGIITCHSLNPEHKDFKINLREVSFLYNVVEVRQPGKRKRWNRAKDFFDFEE